MFHSKMTGGISQSSPQRKSSHHSTPTRRKDRLLRSIPLILSFLILTAPHTAGAWVILSDDFNYLGDPDPLKWFVPDYLDGWGEASCDGNNLVLHTWPTFEDYWSHIYVFSQRNFDAQNYDGCSITFTVYDGTFTQPGVGQEAWAEVGFMRSGMIDPENEWWWNMGVWCAVTESSSSPGVIYIGVQDIGGQGVPAYSGDFPVTITLELEPNIGGVGGVARCYIEGVPGVWDEKVYGKEWDWSPDYTEDFSDSRAFMFIGSYNEASLDGYVWHDSASVEFPDDLPQLNSIILSDTDSDSEDYSNSLTVSVDSEIEYPTEVGYIRFSESPNMYYTGGPWLAYSDPIEATFPTPGDGPRTLYAQVSDSTQTYVSNIVYDDIFIDTQDPTSSCEALPEYTEDVVFDIAYTYSDPSPESGVRWVELWYRRDGGDWITYGSQEPPTGTFSFDSSTTGGDGFYEFEAVACDNAGNVEERTGIPEAETIVITSISLESIVLSDQDSASVDYTNDITIDVLFNTSTEDVVAYMMLSEDPDFSGAPWLPYENPTTFDLSVGDGIKTVYAKLATPEYTESAVRYASILLDTTEPSSEIEELPETTTDAVFTINFTYNDPEPASGIELIEIWYHYQPTISFSQETSFSPVALNHPAKTIQTSPLSQTPQDWILYTTVSPPTQSIDFDSSTTGGDGYYQFISIAQDLAGNREPWPDSPDATTYVNTEGPEAEPFTDCITPNGDGINDDTGFYFPNPNNAVADLTIFDRNLVHVDHTSAIQPAWNATDDAGVLVEGGLYLFQILVEGRVYNGTVLVAR